MEYYCMMVKTGGEEVYKKEAEKVLAETNPGSAVYFFKKIMRTKKGQNYEQALFPGYVFLQIPSLKPEVTAPLRKCPGFYHFLRSNSDITPLCGKDLDYIKNLLGFGEVQGISKAYFDENMRIVITEGPLVGFSGNIIKVNRKRQRVTVMLDMFNSSMKFDMTYDMIEKSPS
ncbi:MAG TPA: transcriptional antiterminator NusG [Treponema sp.]|jgi:transcriptional antiterminator NusG|nr:transcriptional antiterminator NusG [Treponema sp.]HBB43179.1 transcriptional antiterminator NusG [Treponema sp.]HCA20696.1 transcriptional antiterminator NusG [Treponema sp.]